MKTIISSPINRTAINSLISKQRWRMLSHDDGSSVLPCLLQATNRVGAFLAITVSVNNTYRNSATSLTSFWKMALSTTNTMAL